MNGAQVMSAFSLQNTDLVRIMEGKGARRVMLIINLLLVAWIASILANLTWNLLAPPPAPLEPVAVDTGSAAARPDPGLQLIKQLPGWHLMGKVELAPAPVKVSAPIDAPDTRLNLVLHGSLASEDKDRARAIIADPKGKEDQYAIGDTLPGNAELSEIYPDRVILMRGGRYETLRLPDDGQSRNSPGLRRTVSRSPVVPADRLRTVRQQLKQSPRSLYGIVRTTPMKDEDGTIKGYQLSPGRDPQLFEQLGLLEGDVVVQVNDIRLDKEENGVKALKSVQSGDAVSLTVLRNGVEEVMSFSLPE
jgi:general secretion pathway protein C